MKPLVAGSYLVILVLFLAFTVLAQTDLSPDVERRRRSFDAGRAMDHAARIDALTRSSGGRMAGSRGNTLVRGYIEGELARAGLPIRVEPFGDMFGGNLVNVVGVVQGKTNEAVLVCAHHDASDPGPAAVQGTAGLAVLLELARNAAESSRAGFKPRRTLLFAAWDGDASVRRFDALLRR